jgi:hypothetical protein
MNANCTVYAKTDIASLVNAKVGEYAAGARSRPPAASHKVHDEARLSAGLTLVLER